MDLVAFAERVLLVLGQGRFVSTYKYAVLLGLIDLCLEKTSTSGRAPDMVTTAELADRIIEYYWQQVQPYRDGEHGVLIQNKGKQAKVLSLIADFRQSTGKDTAISIHRARTGNPDHWSSLCKEVEWCLVEMPLPRLQRLGNESTAFIYQIHWDENIKRGQWSDQRHFDNRIIFAEGASEHLVRLSGLLRPLIQQGWAKQIAEIKANEIQDSDLSEFLFAPSRISLLAVVKPLESIQDGLCFYCSGALRHNTEVDHFIPWSRYPDNGIDNLVLAHKKCNGHKKDHFAAEQHLEHWVDRAAAHTGELEQISTDINWARNASRSLGCVRGTYGRLHEGASLWLQDDSFLHANPVALQEILSRLPPSPPAA